jgi:hypothetical protein
VGRAASGLRIDGKLINCQQSATAASGTTAINAPRQPMSDPRKAPSGAEPARTPLRCACADLNDRVARLAGGAAIHGRLADRAAHVDRTIDGDVWRHPALTQVCDKRVTSQALSAPSVKRRRLLRRSSMASAASGSAVRWRKSAPLRRQARAVLHQHVAHEAQPALAAGRLAVEPCIGIGGRGMLLVRTLPRLRKLRSPIRPGAGGVPEPSMGPETLH